MGEDSDPPSVDTGHPLDKLPDLAPDPKVWLHPQFWVSISFAFTSVVGMTVGGWMHLDSSVTTMFLTGNLTTHGTASAGMLADKVTRNNIYSSAAKQPPVTQ